MTTSLLRHLPDGRTARILTLEARGITVRLTDLGATILGIMVPDRAGAVANILAGPRDPADHPAGGGPGPYAYMNATCGRVANRLAGSAFTIDGDRFALAANEGANQLHGGPHGFDRAIWRVEEAGARRVTLSHDSPDGDQGYPGALLATASFALEDDALAIRYTARASRPTHVNLVSHLYYNLSGAPGTSILDHRLTIPAEAFLPIDAQGIPTGELRAVAGAPFDFRAPRAIGDRIADDDGQLRMGDGYNHNFVIAREGMHAAAILHDPASGRRLHIETDQPGVQLYTGNALADGYPRRSAVCLETQGWPDAANHAGFPSTRLDPGDTYRSETRLRFDLA